jgi:hypothetical protein
MDLSTVKQGPAWIGGHPGRNIQNPVMLLFTAFLSRCFAPSTPDHVETDIGCTVPHDLAEHELKNRGSGGLITLKISDLVRTIGSDPPKCHNVSKVD